MLRQPPCDLRHIPGYRRNLGHIGKEQGNGEMARSSLRFINLYNSTIVKGIGSQSIDGVRGEGEDPSPLQDVDRLMNLPLHLDASIPQ